ncbi:MFS transporter [Candidatus Cyrtobacter comes]|uniref:MFS transporter n=1 Tax=Candidatus Cyrtobacter comes TaxID=675776 RepID=A0ABU5L7H1_9RICK|nr:MFS transporter [Candidatus Cyrtobacter comes]MDZ5761992.1 MFS transporter [Candidatus Cyrtobacter comes]
MAFYGKITKYSLVPFSLGFSSGLVYLLLASTLSVYLYEHQISLILIGLFAIRLTPYSYKCLFSPIVESIRLKIFPKNFGQRRSWLVATQTLIALLIVSLGLIDPEKQIYILLILATSTAFIATLHDIAADGYRIELSPTILYTNSIHVLGFRTGLVISGAGSMLLLAFLSWREVFFIVASLYVPCIFTLIFIAEDHRLINNRYTINMCIKWFKAEVIDVVYSLLRLPKFYLSLLIIAFFKVSDTYLDSMYWIFLLEKGFTKTEIGLVIQTVSTVFNIFGAFLGAFLISRFRTVYYLLIAEVSAAVTNLLFLLISDANLWILTCINVVEATANGVANVVCISYMSSLCDKRFPASCFALLYSISSIIRFNIATTSGFIVSNYGWDMFFIISSMLSIPSIIAILARYYNDKTK